MARINLNPAKTGKKHQKTSSPNCKKYPSYNYSNEDAVQKLTSYIINSKKTNGEYISYYNIPAASAEAVQDSFTAIQKLYGKADGRHAEHFVISLSEEESKVIGTQGLFEMAEKYCSPFAEEYQILFAIHSSKPEQLHVHIELNPVSFKTGKRLHKDRTFLEAQRSSIKQFTEEKMKNHVK